jgi:hypothetical protein
MDPDQEEEGCFGVVQLVPTRYLKEVDRIEPVFPNDVPRAGEIFSKTGRPTSDWDRMSHTPLLICTLTPEWGMSMADVYGTRLPWIFQQSKKTKKEHKRLQREQAYARGKNHAYISREASGAMAEQLHWGQKQSGADRFVMARKHYKQMKAEKDKRRARKTGLENFYAYQQGFRGRYD